MQEVDKCVEECRESATKHASTIADCKIAFEMEHGGPGLDTKRIAKMIEVLNRELPVRLPGVYFAICNQVRDGKGFSIEFDWSDDDGNC